MGDKNCMTTLKKFVLKEESLFKVWLKEQIVVRFGERFVMDVWEFRSMSRELQIKTPQCCISRLYQFQLLFFP